MPSIPFFKAVFVNELHAVSSTSGATNSAVDAAELVLGVSMGPVVVIIRERRERRTSDDLGHLTFSFKAGVILGRSLELHICLDTRLSSGRLDTRLSSGRLDMRLASGRLDTRLDDTGRATIERTTNEVNNQHVGFRVGFVPDAENDLGFHPILDRGFLLAVKELLQHHGVGAIDAGIKQSKLDMVVSARTGVFDAPGQSCLHLHVGLLRERNTIVFSHLGDADTELIGGKLIHGFASTQTETVRSNQPERKSHCWLGQS